jgi:hypothetical protein
MKYISYTTAEDTISKFFANSDSAIEVTIDHIFSVMDRSNHQLEKNKTWLTNKLTHLKHYNLAMPVYTNERPRRLKGVRLTHQGQEALGRTGDAASVPTTANVARSSVSLNSIAQDIKRFEEENPEIELDLNIRIRKEAAIGQ